MTAEDPDPDYMPEPDEVAPIVLSRSFARTDLGNAERLVARYRDRIRFCPPKRKWLAWDGRRWRWDETGVVMRLAKRTVRSIYDEAARCSDDTERQLLAKHARDSEKASRIEAIVKLASTEEGIPVLPAELDADPWILNVANGTLNLKTGTLRPHDRADMCTKLAPVDYDPAAQHETWFRYLVEATGGDTQYAAFLRRVAGYSLVGVAPEKKFFFVYGPPDTAKSTFLDALGSMLGDYHASASFDTWCTQTSTGGNRGDLVCLAGSRLVTSAEVAKGKRFDEAIMKRVTGGDEIKAAAKYEAEVTFRATWTLLLAANDAPAIHDDDEGAWSRVMRAPFRYVVPPEKRDRRVRETLCDPAQAGAAILAWAVAGCLEWQRDGLGSADAIEQSNADYRAEMDRLGGFLAECCAFEEWDEAVVARKDMRQAYEEWCRENGVRYPLSAKAFKARMLERGAVYTKSNGVPIWRRVRLLQPSEEPQ